MTLQVPKPKSRRFKGLGTLWPHASRDLAVEDTVVLDDYFQYKDFKG